MSTAPQPGRRFTYRDYLTWPDEERWELIDGVPYNMTPAPAIPHQRLVSDLAGQLFNWFRDKPCEYFVSPVDVRLPEPDQTAEDTDTVVQPDLLVVCDLGKVDERGITGAPDFVIEVLSPSSATRDQITKAELYERHGVREYWVIDPLERLVTLRVRTESGRFAPVRFVEARGRIAVSVFEGLELEFDSGMSTPL